MTKRRSVKFAVISENSGLLLFSFESNEGSGSIVYTSDIRKQKKKKQRV